MSIKSTLPNGPLGFGTASLGNMFRNIPEEEAAATVAVAWEADALAKGRTSRRCRRHDRGGTRSWRPERLCGAPCICYCNSARSLPAVWRSRVWKPSVKAS
jgi:hypothetical protein